jgi:hypothetical protein
MFVSTKFNAAAVALLALVIVPAPLLPPLGLTGQVQALLGVSWTTAYLAATLGLHTALYGSLGVVAACTVSPGKKRPHRWLQLLIVPVVVVGIAVLVRSLKLGHVPMLANAAVPMAACALGVVCGLLLRQRGWRATLVATLVVAAGMVWAYWPGVSSELSRATEGQLRRIVATAPQLPSETTSAEDHAGWQRDGHLGMRVNALIAELAFRLASESCKRFRFMLGSSPFGHCWCC